MREQTPTSEAGGGGEGTLHTLQGEWCFLWDLYCHSSVLLGGERVRACSCVHICTLLCHGMLEDARG